LITMNNQNGTDSRNRSALIAVDAGSTLTLTGGLNARFNDTSSSATGRDVWVAFGGAGNGFITTTPFSLLSTSTTNAADLSTGIFSFVKTGVGNWTVNNLPSFFPGQSVYVFQGALTLNGTTTFGVPDATAATAGTVFLNPGGTLVLDSSGTNANNRLSNRLL